MFTTVGEHELTVKVKDKYKNSTIALRGPAPSSATVEYLVIGGGGSGGMGYSTNGNGGGGGGSSGPSIAGIIAAQTQEQRARKVAPTPSVWGLR